MIRFKMISKNFARCLAKISGDGCLYYRYIRYSNKCPNLLNEFKEDILKEFGNINLTYGITNSGTPFIQIHGKNIIKKFLNQLSDFKSRNILIPGEIKNSNKSIKKEYLRAFYDDEGCACLRIFKKTNEWKRTLTLSSNSKKILKEIKGLLLNDFSIPSNKIIKNKKENNICYVLTITGKENFIRFRNQINFKHPRKSKILDLIIECYDKTFKRNTKEFYRIRKKLIYLKSL
ncbi:MAG: hypothetical protein JW924_14585 [Fusobacteriaceae bacterium]|nr:hypothetical protein [Fusobacteriaceae bacterium]